MADDAAQVLRALGIPAAHVAGFSGGSIVAQELALRHPELVRSLVLQSTWPVPDPYLRAWIQFVCWLVEVAPASAPSWRASTLDLYGAGAQRRDRRADHREGARPPAQAGDRGRPAVLDALIDHDTTDRLPQIGAPTLVLAGGRDPNARPELSDQWNARVDAFWREIEARAEPRGAVRRAVGAG